MGLLNKNTGGAMKKRVDFQNPATKKAIKKLVEFFEVNKKDYELEVGESYQGVAEDIICEAIQEPFVVSSTLLEESIFSRSLKILKEKLEESEKEDSNASESDREDAYQAIEAIAFTGSEKQIKWASDIAHKAADDITAAWKKKDFKLPATAKWWIDNREDIDGALAKL